MRLAVPLAVIVLAAAAPALGKDKDEPAPPPQAMQELLDCKALADPAARLACYDKRVTVIEAGLRDRQLVVTDRETMREARRGLFGLRLPRLKLFGSDDDTEEVKQIESTIAGVRSANDGMPVFVLADESRWKQTEGRNMFAKSGDKILIKRTAMGGYMANIDGQPGVRVIRIVN